MKTLIVLPPDNDNLRMVEYIDWKGAVIIIVMAVIIYFIFIDNDNSNRK
jgi:hypothetical protein